MKVHTYESESFEITHHEISISRSYSPQEAKKMFLSFTSLITNEAKIISLTLEASRVLQLLDQEDIEIFYGHIYENLKNIEGLITSRHISAVLDIDINQLLTA